jgi:hypothetical protein
VIPTKVADVPAGTWQDAQLSLMPAWLMREPLNRAPLGTGSAGTDEPAPTWQDSQDRLVGKWLPGSPTIEKLFAGLAKLAAAAPWHCAQFDVVLGAFTWILASVGIAA